MSSFVSSDEDQVKEYTSRYKFLYIAIIISSAVIFSRLWYLQIIQGKELRSYSERNRVKKQKIPAPRGLILDRNNQVLVDNLPGFEATISPQYATKLSETAEAVGEILEIPKATIIKQVKKSVILQPQFIVLFFLERWTNKGNVRFVN